VLGGVLVLAGAALFATPRRRDDVRAQESNPVSNLVKS
jgi:hypothetical protein